MDRDANEFRSDGLRRRHSWSAFQNLDDDGDELGPTTPGPAAATRSFQPPVGVEQSLFSPPVQTRTSSNNTTTGEHKPFVPPPPPQQSMPDQFMNLTLGLLKMAGGATLSTTGKLASPPLQAFRDIFIPALWQMTVHYLDDITPLRVKDWFRIVASGWHHLLTVMGNTTPGKIFGGKLVTVGCDLVDCASSDVSRQAVMDGMATLVKLSEALHTPETKALLDQLAVLSCRMVDVAASGRTKQLLHDLTDTVWSGLEVFSDPAATLAFAEVTAYLCYALEMEDARHSYEWSGTAKRRHERNVHQKQTYVDPNLVQDGHSTVEQVLLSSLGEHDATNRMGTTTAAADGDWLRREAEAHESGASWMDNARDDIDLSLLQERLSMRTQELARQREDWNRAQASQRQQPPQEPQNIPEPQPNESNQQDIEELVVETVDENDEEVEYVQETRRPPQPAKPQTRVQSDRQFEQVGEIEEWIAENPVLVPDAGTSFGYGESAYGRFFRRLDEVMTKKRTQAVTDILNEAGQEGQTWFPRAAAAAGAGNERGQDTIKSRIAAVQRGAKRVRGSEIGVGNVELMANALRSKSGQQSQVASTLQAIIGLVVLFWFVLGLYGGYVFMSSKVGMRMPRMPSIARSTAPQEVVVRIVREVVHVGPDGNVIETGSDPLILGDSADNIAACIAKAMD